MLCTNSCSMLSWHLAQVSGTLSLAIGDLGSPAPRMSCSPWQSVQTAAVPEPAATALPCTLCWYEIKGAELTPDDAMTNFWPWHAPQVCGIFERATFDFGVAPREYLVYIAMAILAPGDVAIAGHCALGVDTVIVSGLLVSVTGGADGLGGSWIVRYRFDVGVAIGAT